MKQNQSGFTLIEIAIVLVIIGLLLGGVLKGQELINSAKVKNIATDFRNIPVYIYGYQDKYRTLPGDDAGAVAHLGGTCTAATCVSTSGTTGNGVLDGNWNDPASGKGETAYFWQHIRLAGLAPGPTLLTDPQFYPTNAMGGMIGIQSGTSDVTKTPITDSTAVNAIRGTYIICSTGILGKFVKQLDLTMDDGDPNTGSMMAGLPISSPVVPGEVMKAATLTGAGKIDDALTYTVCMGI